MSSPIRTCTRCGTETSEWCPTCLAAFETRTPADQMTPEQRAEEFEGWYGILEIPFATIHQRLTELIGRDIFDIELALNKEALLAEIRGGPPAKLSDTLDRIPGNVVIIEV